MALALKNLFGNGSRAKSGEDGDRDAPTTQVKMNGQPSYDPMGSVSIMEQLKSANAETKSPSKLPLIGHFPIVQQCQVLGVLLMLFVALAVLMVYLNNRQATQVAATAGTATEMQMLSQRLARGTSLAVQGQVSAFPGVKDSRDRFRADLDALAKGGNVHGVNVDVVSDDKVQGLLGEVTSRWDRVEANAGKVIDNEQALVSLSKGLAGINQGNNALLELAQQAPAQVAGAGNLRDV